MSEQEFLEQIRSNQGIIFKIVSLYAADPEEKKDLYQEVLLQCWKSWPAFRNESKFSTWLYRICLNTVFTSLRKKSKLRYYDELADSQSIGAVSLEQEDSQALYQAIRRLTDSDRALILLHLDGYSNSEIGDMVGIPVNNLGVKLYRIRQRLAHLLNKTGHGDK